MIRPPPISTLFPYTPLFRSDKLPPVPASYSAWGTAETAFWQSTELEPRIIFWKSRLAGIRRLWSVPDEADVVFRPDRKSTRLNSSHLVISYAVFCLKKKKLS